MMIIFQTLCPAVSVGESLQRIELRHTRWDNRQSKLFFRWDQPPRNFHRLDDNLPRRRSVQRPQARTWSLLMSVTNDLKAQKPSSSRCVGPLCCFDDSLVKPQEFKIMISLSCCKDREAMCIINIIISFSSVKHLKQRIYNLLFRMWT